MSDKICKNLDTIHGFGFVCKLDLEKDPKRYSAARCFMEPHARAYLDAELCDGFEEKGTKVVAKV